MFEDMGSGVNEHILWLDVSVADSDAMNVGKASKHLVTVQFDQDIWEWLSHLNIVFQYSIQILGHIIHNHVQVDFLTLKE